MRASSAVSSGSAATSNSPGNCRTRRSEVRHRLQREVLVLRRREVDRALGGLEAQRLRPDLVFAGRERREIVVAGLVGVDAGGDGRAVVLGGHRHAAELLARRRGDRAAQQLIGRLRRRGRCLRPRGGGGVPCNPARVSPRELVIEVLPWWSARAASLGAGRPVVLIQFLRTQMIDRRPQTNPRLPWRKPHYSVSGPVSLAGWLRTNNGPPTPYHNK